MTIQPPASNSALFAAVPLAEPGTPMGDWVEAARFLPPLDIRELNNVVLVVAHPDDECLGPGGLVNTLTSRGKRVTVVIVSYGEQSHAHDPGVDPLKLAAIRQAESVAAARILGTETPIFLGYPDGGLEVHPDAIAHDLGQILERAMGENNGIPPAVLTHWRGDGHPDHEAVGRTAVQAAELLLTGEQTLTLLEFPLWALHWDFPRKGQVLNGQAAVGPSEAHENLRKRQAASCFTSQILPWPQTASSPVMPEHVVNRFLNVPELFLSTSLTATSPDFQNYQDAVDGLDHMEKLYVENQDPWDMETSGYEKAKRRATIDALPRARYELCFEAGCSIGMLTIDLAQRADRVVGWEPVERAALRARKRIAEMEDCPTLRAESVRIESRALSALNGEFGPAGADLVILSEVLYYIPRAELTPIISELCVRASPGAHVAAVHWKHPVAGWPDGGAESHAVLFREPKLRHLHRNDTSGDYLLDVFEVEQRN